MPPCHRRVTSKINLAIYHQGWQLRFISHANKFCPDADETLKGHMLQTWQVVRSDKPHNNPAESEATSPLLTPDPVLPTEGLHIWD